MLSGDNGIIQRATDAKEMTGIAEVVENAKLDVLAQIAENKGQNISKDQLKTILNKYFLNIDNLELPDDLSSSDIKLNANQTYGGYKNIALSDIYNGTFSVTNATNPVPDITKHIWIASENGEESDIRFDKNGNVYTGGESVSKGTYTLDGTKFEVVMNGYPMNFEWDGEKFVMTMDDGNGGSLTITLTEMIPATFKFTIDGTEYTAEENMTWADWVASDYNTGNYYVVNGDGYVYSGDKWVVYYNEENHYNEEVRNDGIIAGNIDYFTQDVAAE